MNESLGSGHYYELKLNNKKVGFCSIGRFCHPIVRDIMKIQRLVVVPEFQGFGIGLKFMNEISNLYETDRIRIITSLKPFIKTLSKNRDWKCLRFSRVSDGGKHASKSIQKSLSNNRITATFEKRQYNKNIA